MRIIPRDLLENIFQAILDKKITPDDILRRNRKDKKSLLDELNIDHDPFIMGYDSTILKICLFLIDHKPNIDHDFQNVIRVSLNMVSNVKVPKPFLILAGISGTGKSRWVREQAKQWSAELENFALVPVRPDWHEPSDLLGSQRPALPLDQPKQISQMLCPIGFASTK